MSVDVVSSCVLVGWNVRRVCGVGGEGGRGVFFFSSRRRHPMFTSDWSSDVCSSDLENTRFDGAYLQGANLKDTGIKLVQIKFAFTDEDTQLPDGSH